MISLQIMQFKITFCQDCVDLVYSPFPYQQNLFEFEFQRKHTLTWSRVHNLPQLTTDSANINSEFSTISALPQLVINKDHRYLLLLLSILRSAYLTNGMVWFGSHWDPAVSNKRILIWDHDFVEQNHVEGH